MMVNHRRQETIEKKAYAIVDDLSRNGKANYLEVIKNLF